MKKTFLFLALLLVSFTLLAACGKQPSPPTEEDTHTHSWDDGTVIRQATCLETGLIRYACTSCGEQREEILPLADHVLDEGDLIYAPTCGSVGVRLNFCTVCDEMIRTVIPPTGLHVWDGGKIHTVPTNTSEGDMIYTCSVCGNTKLEPLDLAVYEAEVNSWKQKLATFNIADFGGSSITTDLVAAAQGKGKTYAAPPVSPTEGQHPRLLFTKSDIPNILQAMKHDENQEAVAAFNTLVQTQTDGVLPAPTTHSNGFYNFDASVLSIIQAKAMHYQLTGNAISGYEAVYAMKNFLLTLDIQYIYSDQCRQFGYTMYITALVYDWCYDLLTDTDRLELTSGVEHLICTGSTPGYDGKAGSAKMEVGFPPVSQGCVSGHGTECQILRDYLSFAIAVYDELPTWWSMVGGRFYQEYVPTRNIFYAAGMYPQGISNYADFRYIGDIWSAWIIKGMSGSVPYNADDMKQVIHSMFSYETVGGRTFNSGDSGSATSSLKSDLRTSAIISAYLFNDPVARVQASRVGLGLSSFNSGIANVTATEFLICSSNGVTCAEDPHEGYPLILYHDGYLQQIIARNTWEKDSAAVLMRIGERTTANHDHQDAGTFQIWYKSMLAGDTGCYDSYGSNHHYYYHQATVAHNGLLIYNPAKASTNKGYYSGGQRKLTETSTLSGWLSDTYRIGELSGVEYVYNDAEKTDPYYAYIAGDIAPAYDSSTVSEVTRRMLTVYTGDETFPMIFVVYDNITATSGDFKKTFLLHTVTEPTVEGNTVTTVNGNGKLVLQNLLGGDNITKLGGEGQNYIVNGAQLEALRNSQDGFWGRVDISPNLGNLTDRLLNVMYVTDASTTSAAEATLVSADGAVGTQILNNVILFVPEKERSVSAITATSTGTGEIRYFVSGVHEGTWKISVNGTSCGTVTATADGGFLSFTAPAGRLELTPGDDIRPSNTAPIAYMLNGGLIGADAPKYYEFGTALTLPIPSREGALFDGWFTSPDFSPETRVTEVPSTATDKFTVYAKWITGIFRVEYDASFPSLTDTKQTVGELSYNMKTGCHAYAEIGTDGKTYLVWTKSDKDPQIDCYRSMPSFLEGEDTISFTLSLAKNGSDACLPSAFRLRGSVSNHDVTAVFNTTTDGRVTVDGTTILTLTQEMQTFTVTVDFRNGTIQAYDGTGRLLTTTALQISYVTGASNTLDWMKTMTGFIFCWYAGGTDQGSLCIGGIEVRAGRVW